MDPLRCYDRFQCMDDPDEYQSVRELDALLQGTDWWIGTSHIPYRLRTGEQLHSPSHKPRESVWFSKGGWFGHDNGGIRTHVMLAKIDASKVCTIHTIEALDAFMERFRSTTSALAARSRTNSRSSVTSTTSIGSATSAASAASGAFSESSLSNEAVPLYHWDKVAREYSGWAMPVNLYNPEKEEGWGVCGYDVSSLALWDPKGAIVQSIEWDLTEDGDVSPDGWSTTRHTILPLVKSALVFHNTVCKEDDDETYESDPDDPEYNADDGPDDE